MTLVCVIGLKTYSVFRFVHVGFWHSSWSIICAFGSVCLCISLCLGMAGRLFTGGAVRGCAVPVGQAPAQNRWIGRTTHFVLSTCRLLLSLLLLLLLDGLAVAFAQFGGRRLPVRRWPAWSVQCCVCARLVRLWLGIHVWMPTRVAAACANASWECSGCCQVARAQEPKSHRTLTRA